MHINISGSKGYILFQTNLSHSHRGKSWLPTYLNGEGSSHHVVQLTFLMALIFAQTALLGFQSSRFPRTLSFTLLLHRSHFRVFNLPFHIYIYIYIFGAQECKKRGLHLEAPSCKVLYDNIRICGHIEIVPIHVGQDQGSSGEGLLYHVWALIGEGKLSSMIRHDLVVLSEDQAAFFKDSRSNLLAKCSVDVALVQLSMAHCAYALLVYHGTLWLCASRLSCSISK